MTHPAINIENLSKVYRLGVKEEAPDTLASAFTGVLRSPLRNLQRLRRLSRFKGDEDGADTLWALKDVSFAVAEGEVLGVIGRNGAGKSTLLKILSRITEPTSGRAVIRGRVSSLLEVGTGFHPELTGRDNIYMNGTILGMTKREIDRKFDEIVDFSGVERFLDTPIKRYSSGMNVRLAFAVAAHLEPEILIIDEVLAVGDAEFQKKCMGKMRDVAQGGKTVLFVSHNMAAVGNLCNRVVIIQEGQLAFCGPCDVGVRHLTAVEHTRGGTVSLLEHPGRRRGRVPILRSLTLRNCSGDATDQFTCGEPVILSIELDSAKTPKCCEIAVLVHDSFGSQLFTVGTYLTASSGSASPFDGEGPLECRIDDLPLPPGTYSITLKAGPLQQIQLDTVECASSFDVIGADYYGNGRVPNSARGAFLMRSSWSQRT